MTTFNLFRIEESIPAPPEIPLKEWRNLFDEQTLTVADILKYINAASTNFFIKPATPSHGRTIFDEEAAKNAILHVIEEFICGDDPQAMFERISKEGNISSVCGKVFKIGEPTYNCRECCMDYTCVLCVTCFKQSEHQQHKYKMATSSGGGCCDCGDAEAWKQSPGCKEHTLSEELIESSIITDRMISRCYILFDSILQYCVKSLDLETDASNKCLDGGVEEDLFCTVLYNDETHTFEQVIQTLTRIVGCESKDALEYVSIIDREGRAVVKCASFEVCRKLKTDIEKQAILRTNKITPLKVGVLHKNAVAQQQFALQMLEWFQQFLARHTMFRKVFADIITQNSNHNLTHILKNDSKLWKTARASWHRLLITGMLMEYEHKKKLAITFTRMYPIIMQDFIHDDHDYSFSIVSLCLQLFVVPSLAQHLIANESAFFKLMYTFYTESIEKYVKKKTLQLARNTFNLNEFKRACFILSDLRYLLCFRPDEWTNDLRKNFLHGVQVLVKLLSEMQGMDSVSRQTGQHMEYEPEWESAFNLHIKLAHVITLVIETCSTDKVVLVKAYRMVVASLHENEFILADVKTDLQELADHSTNVNMYDVLTKPVSIHLPLSRFFAGLYLHLAKFELTYDSAACTTSTKLSPEHLIEPVLCTQTMIAQVQSGLWRRNGFSLINQLYFYRSVKCRMEMLDRDIVVLQIGASLIESNEFLIHLLSKFNLCNWTNDYERVSMDLGGDEMLRQVINMVDEMLELLIVIIGERYVPGIGILSDDDKIKNELIQHLCIAPHSHSELTRTLPETMQENRTENIIDQIAVFRKPFQSDKKGVYELKSDHYDQFNMYFYHFTKEEKSRAEESQRKRRKGNNELMCCPPPKLPQLSKNFNMLANLLQCDVMFLIMKTVLQRATNYNIQCFSESHVQKVLHLIGYGIQEQQSEYYPFLQFTERAQKWNIFELLESLKTSPRVKSNIDLISWTLSKWKEVTVKPSIDDVEMVNSTEAAAVKCAAEIEQEEKQKRAKLAAERRSRIMTQMENAQKSFMTTNADMLEYSKVNNVLDKDLDWKLLELEEDSMKICLGDNRTIPSVMDEEHSCIVCSESSIISVTGVCMVYPVFIQQSKILSFASDSTVASPHISSCGHVMHYKCFKEYYDNELAKENRRPNRLRIPGSFNIEKNEFLCPLCRCICNSVAPILPVLSKIVSSSSNTAAKSNEAVKFDWLFTVMQKYSTCLEQRKHNPDLRIPDFDKIIVATENGKEFANILEPHNRNLVSHSYVNVLESFSSLVHKIAPYPRADNIPHRNDPTLSVWHSSAYTIESLETFLRVSGKPLLGHMSIRHTSCLSTLIRIGSYLVSIIDDQLPSILLDEFTDLMSNVFGNEPTISVTEWETFRMLVMLTFLMSDQLYGPKLKCIIISGNTLEHFLLKIMFAANMTRIIISNGLILDEILLEDQLRMVPKIEAVDVDDESTTQTMEIDESVESPLLKYFLAYNRHVIEKGLGIDLLKLNHTKLMNKILESIKQNSQVFLRCCCIFYHFMTNVELSEQFSSIGGDSFESMCEYLGLNADIEFYFAKDSPFSLYMERLANTNTTSHLNVMSTVPTIKKLIELPDDYSDLINQVSSYVCPSSFRDDSRSPTLCLVCGRVMCSMTYCCQEKLEGESVGACTYHSHICGGGVGIFLRIRECEILFLGMNKGSLLPPPYLDEYGETDQGLRRGNPLKLSTERYLKLNLLWLSHGLHEAIARSMELSNHTIASQWQHL